jgi:pullulanase
LLGILRYTDSEVFVELINPSEDELNIEVQEITFLQNLKFLPELKKLLTEKVISGKTNLELKMKI